MAIFELNFKQALESKHRVWRRRLATAVAAALVVSSALAHADNSATADAPAPDHPSVAETQSQQQAATAPGDLTAHDLYHLQLPNSNLTELGLATPAGQTPNQTVYTFFDRLFVFMGGLSLDNTLRDGMTPAIKNGINTMIPNPWVLSNNAAVWRDQFQYNENRFATSILASTYPLYAANGASKLRWDSALSPYTADDAVGFTKNLAAQVAGSLQPDVAIDYGVNRLASLPGFPHSEAAWDKTENAVAENALPIAAAAVAVGAAADLGALSVGGNPIHLHDKDYNIGWHASVDHLGVSLAPNLTAGPAFSTSKGLELSAGAVEHVNAAAGAEKSGFNFYAKIPIVRPQDGSQWEVGLLNNGHYDLEDGNAANQGRFKLSSDLYFKKNDIFGNGRISQFIGDINYTTNFATQQALTASLGVSEFNNGTTVSAYAKAARDSTTASANLNQVGVFVAGTWEPQSQITKGKMTMGADRAARALLALRKQQAALKACEDRLKNEPRHALPSDLEVYAINTTLDDCRSRTAELNQAHVDLRAEFKDFLEARTVYFMQEGRASRNAITDWDGPLSFEVMSEIRKEIDLPEYDTPPSGETALVPSETQDPEAHGKATPGQPASSHPARGTWGSSVAAQ